MGYATFLQAKGFVGSGYGDCDPVKVAEVVNTIRQHWYNWYLEERMFLDAVECFRVHTFCLDCNTCADTYRGVTMPRAFETVEAIWWNDFPLPMQSDWREFQVGISHECDCRIQKFDVPGSFSTHLDIGTMRPVNLLVVALNPADAGKRVVIRGIGAGGEVLTHELRLSVKPQRTPMFRRIDHRGGILKDLTIGRVVIMDELGKVYGQYEPDETVPSYRRIKLTGLADGCEVVNIRAARRYFPLYSDDDVVESDNVPAWDAMARYLRLYRMTDKTRETIAGEAAYLGTAKAMITGAQARAAGAGTQAALTIKTPRFMRQGLRRGFGRY